MAKIMLNIQKEIYLKYQMKAENHNQNFCEYVKSLIRKDMGMPPLPPKGEAKCKRQPNIATINVYMDDDLKKLCKNKASEKGVSMTKYIRELIEND